MIKSIIVAMSENRAIGLENELPWHMPADLKRFRQLTMGHHLIMGRRTYESLRGPLPGRKIIVLTRNPYYSGTGFQRAHSLEAAFALAEAAGEVEAFIGGGAQVYAEALTVADLIYMTLIHARIKGDAFFPAFNQDQWVEAWGEYHPAEQDPALPYTFKLLARREGAHGPQEKKGMAPY